MELKDILIQILCNQKTMLEYIWLDDKFRVQKDIKKTEDMLDVLRDKDNISAFLKLGE